jgi:tRNA-dihydrouridine synthase B
MFETTKCDAVMIGRGSIGNPWIFNDCYQYIYKGIEPKQKKINEIKRILIKHLILLNKYEGEKKAILLIRPHINKYFNGIENHKEMTKKIILLKSIDEIKKIIKKFKN